MTVTDKAVSQTRGRRLDANSLLVDELYATTDELRRLAKATT